MKFKLKLVMRLVWLWVAIKLENKKIVVGLSISKERNMFVAERFLSDIIKEYRKHLSINRWCEPGTLKLVDS